MNVIGVTKTIIIFAAKKVSRIDPQDFITQDNVTTALKIAGHIVKLIF